MVFARSIDRGDFRLRSTSTLGGHRVASFQIPRKLERDGSLDLDFFGFTLADPGDVGAFEVGEVVLLEE